jgi:hypothetical protein
MDFLISVVAGVLGNLVFAALLGAGAYFAFAPARLARVLGIAPWSPFVSQRRIDLVTSQDGEPERPLCSPSEIRALQAITRMLALVGVSVVGRLAGDRSEVGGALVSLGGPGLNSVSRELLAVANNRGFDVELNPGWGEKSLRIGDEMFRQKTDGDGRVVEDYGIILSVSTWQGLSVGGRNGILVAGMSGLGTEGAALNLLEPSCVRQLHLNQRLKRDTLILVRVRGSGYLVRSVARVSHFTRPLQRDDSPQPSVSGSLSHDGASPGTAEAGTTEMDVSRVEAIHPEMDTLTSPPPVTTLLDPVSTPVATLVAAAPEAVAAQDSPSAPPALRMGDAPTSPASPQRGSAPADPTARTPRSPHAQVRRAVITDVVTVERVISEIGPWPRRYPVLSDRSAILSVEQEGAHPMDSDTTAEPESETAGGTPGRRGPN